MSALQRHKRWTPFAFLAPALVVLAVYVLRRHPGDTASWTRGRNGPFEFDTVPAGSMIHYFRADRPGQRRGIPDITPALPLFAQLRRPASPLRPAAEAR